MGIEDLTEFEIVSGVLGYIKKLIFKHLSGLKGQT